MRKLTVVALLFTLILLLGSNANAQSGQTYHVAADGRNNATCDAANPCLTFPHVMPKVQAGDTLIVGNGIYFQQIRPVNSGTATAPITIRAAVDGQATIDGEGQIAPLFIHQLTSYIHVEGIVFRNGGGTEQAVMRVMGDHNVLRRVSAYDADTDGNTAVISLGASADHNLVEDCIAAGTGRKMIVAYKGVGNTFRRCFAWWKSWDGRDRPSNEWPWGNNIESYNATYTSMENSIAYGPAPERSISVMANHSTASAIGVRVLGSMAVGVGVYDFCQDIPDDDPWKYDHSVFGDDWTRSRDCTRPKTNYTLNRTDGKLALYRDFGWNCQREGIAQYVSGTFRDNLFQDIFSYNHAGLGLGVCGGGQEPIKVNRATVLNSGLDAPGGDGGTGAEMHYDSLDSFRIDDSKITDIQNMRGGEVTDYTTMNGTGAKLCNRYVDGALTDEPLWPWPMQERIYSELGFSVQDEIVPILADNGALDDCGVTERATSTPTDVPGGTVPSPTPTATATEWPTATPHATATNTPLPIPTIVQSDCIPLRLHGGWLDLVGSMLSMTACHPLTVTIEIGPVVPPATAVPSSTPVPTQTPAPTNTPVVDLPACAGGEGTASALPLTESCRGSGQAYFTINGSVSVDGGDLTLWSAERQYIGPASGCVVGDYIIRVRGDDYVVNLGC